MNLAYLCVIVAIASLMKRSNSQQCLDENGKNVDWFALYKIPHIPDHPNENIKAGTAYLYTTSDIADKGWILSNNTILDGDSFPGKTLSVVIGNEVEDLLWIFYNDQPPNAPFTFTEGHTKGAVVASRNKGYWLIHSVPKFPVVSRDEGYVYPKTGTIYGQSFLCISLNKDDLEVVGTQLMTNDAYVFESVFQGSLDKEFPTLKKAANMERLKESSSKVAIRSVKDVSFVSFAKSNTFERDLYSQWVSASLTCELLVETWLRDERLPSDCNDTYTVYNVADIKWPSSDIAFSNSKDHSKWAVSAEKEHPWVCIGDINRDKTQFVRGGGTVCIDNSSLWQIYHNMVASIEPCQTD